MLPSEDEEADSEPLNSRHRCALCRLSRDSLLGQGQLIQCRSPNNFKKAKGKFALESNDTLVKSETFIEKSLPANNNKPRWTNQSYADELC